MDNKDLYIPSLGLACALDPSAYHNISPLYLLIPWSTSLLHAQRQYNISFSPCKYLDMAANEELFDLSLFAESPAYDRHITVPHIPLPRPEDHGDPLQRPRLRSHTVSTDYANKPLPPLPRRMRYPKPRYAGLRGCDVESRCILRRIQRIGSNERSNSDGNTLLQRRNGGTPPQLTLSVPQAQPWSNRGTASAMIWMPEEQMWLVTGEVGRQTDAEDLSPPPAYTTQSYTPPSYTQRTYPHSEPSPNLPPSFDLTPPMTPIQQQLQSLIQPPLDRDEERLSPLFAEAMNSVPMTDPNELFSSQLTLDTELAMERSLAEQIPRPKSAAERSFRSLNPEPISPISVPVRSVSAASRSSWARSDTSDTQSFYSAVSVNLSQPTHSANRWAGLAQRVARPDVTRD